LTTLRKCIVLSTLVLVKGCGISVEQDFQSGSNNLSTVASVTGPWHAEKSQSERVSVDLIPAFAEEQIKDLADQFPEVDARDLRAHPILSGPVETQTTRLSLPKWKAECLADLRQFGNEVLSGLVIDDYDSYKRAVVLQDPPNPGL
jgi:hypothetical protein